MSSRDNPIPWLAWAAAGVLCIVTTRNPILLTLAMATILIVRLSLRSTSRQERLAWRMILRIGAAVAVISVLFNLLTVHVGDQTFGHLPSALPIVGGVLTYNALLYGMAGGLALFSLILMAATFATAVDRSTLIRLLPSSFGTAGSAAIVALSIFPQTIRAAGEVREAQTARGFQVRSIRDLEPLLVPVLHLGLEHAFELAESVEARGFGGRNPTSPHTPALRRLGAPLGLVLAAAGVVTAGLGHLLIGCLLLATGLFLLWLAIRQRTYKRRSLYRPVIWTNFDLFCTVAATFSASLVLIALVFTSGLEYSPYPTLSWPSLALLPLMAVVLLIAPAFASSETMAA